MKTEEEVLLLIENYVADLTKKDIDKFSRAALIRRLVDSGMSVRGIAKKYNVPHTTVTGWLLYDTISEKQYKEELRKGETATTIFKRLRGDKDHLRLELDKFLADTRSTAIHYRNKRKNLETSTKTILLVKDAIDALNQLYVELELCEKKGVVK